MQYKNIIWGPKALSLMVPLSTQQAPESRKENLHYQHMLQPHDRTRFLGLVRFLADQGTDLYLAGSVVRNFIEQGLQPGTPSYGDIDLVFVDTELTSIRDNSLYRKLEPLFPRDERATTVGLQIGEYGFNVTHINHPLKTYLDMHRGATLEHFGFSPLPTLDEIRSRISLAPFHVIMVNGNDFRQSLKQ